MVFLGALFVVLIIILGLYYMLRVSIGNRGYSAIVGDEHEIFIEQSIVLPNDRGLLLCKVFDNRYLVMTGPSGDILLDKISIRDE